MRFFFDFVFTFTLYEALFKLILISCFCIWQVSAQSIGDWRMHINYQNAESGALGSSNIMVATQKSVYLYDFDETSLLILDKAKGLSDYGVSAIHYEAFTGTYLLHITIVI